jgi:hypothetical protein
MARFRLTASHELPTSAIRQHYRAGTVICDGNSPQPGYVIWTGLNAQSMTGEMEPLDSGATTMKSQSKFASVTVKNTWFTGSASIQP